MLDELKLPRSNRGSRRSSKTRRGSRRGSLTRREQNELNRRVKEQKRGNNKYQEEQDICSRITFIDHDSPFRVGWDILIAFNLLYISFSLPFVLAFVPHHPPGIKAADHVVDILFGFDIFFNFFTTVEAADGEKITRWCHCCCCTSSDPNEKGKNRSVACTYLKTWFLIDFISTVPLDIFIKVPENNSTDISRIGKIAKVMRAFKFLKMLRLSKLSTKIRYLQSEFDISNATLKIGRFLLLVYLVVHWFACAFFIVARVQDFPDDGFAKVYLSDGPDGHNGALSERDPKTQYLACIYWSVMIISTVGLGDISPGTSVERFMCFLCMFVGAALFAYGITNMVELVSNLDQDAGWIACKQDQIKRVLEKMKVREMIRNQSRYYLLNKQYSSSVEMYDLDPLIDRASGILKTNIFRDFTYQILFHARILQQFGDKFIRSVACYIKGFCHGPDELILDKNCRNENIFFITRGTVEIVLNPQRLTKEISQLAAECEPVRSPHRPSVTEIKEYNGTPEGLGRTWSSLNEKMDKEKIAIKLEETETKVRAGIRRASIKLGRKFSDGGINRQGFVEEIEATQVILTSGCSFNEGAALLNKKSTLVAFSISYVDVYIITNHNYRTVLEGSYPDGYMKLLNEFTIRLKQEEPHDYSTQMSGEEACRLICEREHKDDRRCKISRDNEEELQSKKILNIKGPRKIIYNCKKNIKFRPDKKRKKKKLKRNLRDHLQRILRDEQHLCENCKTTDLETAGQWEIQEQKAPYVISVRNADIHELKSNIVIAHEKLEKLIHAFDKHNHLLKTLCEALNLSLVSFIPDLDHPVKKVV